MRLKTQSFDSPTDRYKNFCVNRRIHFLLPNRGIIPCNSPFIQSLTDSPVPIHTHANSIHENMVKIMSNSENEQDWEYCKTSRRRVNERSSEDNKIDNWQTVPTKCGGQFGCRTWHHFNQLRLLISVHSGTTTNNQDAGYATTALGMQASILGASPEPGWSGRVVAGRASGVKIGVFGVGHWLVRMAWRPSGWSLCLPLLSSLYHKKSPEEDFFWHRLTWVVLEKGQQNGCVCVCVCACTCGMTTI